MSLRWYLPSLAFAALLCAPTASWAQCATSEIAVLADRDNTLYEDAVGGLSNGAGSYFFAGNTIGAGLRRGLVRFDVAGNLPAGATVTAATLQLSMSRTFSGDPFAVSLHPTLADWGEGTSAAGGPEGMGGAAASGDATWIHTFSGSGLWTSPGGDFFAAASATTLVSATGPYAWGSTAAMVADVQGWLDDPASNYGWTVLGEENLLRTAQRFNSRENPAPAAVPVLCVAATGGGLVEIPALGDVGLLALALALAAVALRRLM